MIFKLIANNENPDSLATKLRRKRFSFFFSMLSKLERPIKILDVGGTEQFWQMQGFGEMEDVKITLLNLEEHRVSRSGFTSIKGDACDLKFADQSFDVVFSNSVIEHVGDRNNQIRMAQEAKRVGVRYFIQTPNKNFLMEPHFVFPLFQFLPINVRANLAMNFKLGWFDRQPSFEQARSLVESITLLTRNELRAIFPDSNLYEEKFFGMTKSFIVYAGWDQAPE